MISWDGRTESFDEFNKRKRMTGVGLMMKEEEEVTCRVWVFTLGYRHGGWMRMAARDEEEVEEETK